jgi:hypothetical protein
VYSLEANWAIMWSVGKGDVAVKCLMSIFEEIFDQPIKFSQLNFSSSSTLNFSENGHPKKNFA